MLGCYGMVLSMQQFPAAHQKLQYNIPEDQYLQESSATLL
jgi:hypothetical protein